MSYYEFDEIDQKILEECVAARDKIDRPRIGDFVRFPTGQLERFSYDCGDRLQTSPIRAGSFYLGRDGLASFSGSLNPPIPLDSVRLTDETLQGEFWFFHHNQVGAGRGVGFSIPCRVYSTTAAYDGFLSI